MKSPLILKLRNLLTYQLVVGVFPLFWGVPSRVLSLEGLGSIPHRLTIVAKAEPPSSCHQIYPLAEKENMKYIIRILKNGTKPVDRQLKVRNKYPHNYLSTCFRIYFPTIYSLNRGMFKVGD